MNENMNNKSIVFNVGLFLVYVANAIIAVPSLRKDFEEFYNTDKFRFYEKAKFSQYYNHDNISEQTLASEVAMRRAYGILLCAEEDESVREFVYNKLLNTDGCFEELVKNPTQADINAFAKKLSKYTAKTNNETTAPTFFLAYLLYVKFGTDTDNEAVKRCLAQTHEIFWIANTRKKELWNNIFRYSESNGTALPKTMRPVIRNLRFGFDIANFTKFFNSVTATKLELYHIIKTYCDSGNEELIDMLKASKVADIATMIMQAMGVSLDEICGCIDISKNEQDMVIKAIAHNSYESLIVAGKKVPFNKVDVTSYFTAHIFMIMAKEYRNMKEFYFRNNSETQFLELQRLENIVEEKDLEIEHLKTKLASADEKIERQRNEIMRLTDEIFSEHKEIAKPYASELSELNGKIRELEKSLETEQAKNPELNALREFAFAAQSDYIPPETTVTLAEILRGKKIIIVGGHINWRNRMKERYPAIEFLDGHSVSINNAIFDKADFTLFYASNMSHKLYEKIVNHLRNRKLKFHYLGRSKNPELIEAEIVAILQEKM